MSIHVIWEIVFQLGSQSLWIFLNGKNTWILRRIWWSVWVWFQISQKYESWNFYFSNMLLTTIELFCILLPKMYVISQIGRINQFILQEGVDSHGVTTMLLTFNCTTNIIVDNKSNVFGLHIHPSSIKLFFGPLNFSKAQVKFVFI